MIKKEMVGKVQENGITTEQVKEILEKQFEELKDSLKDKKQTIEKKDDSTWITFD